MHHTHKDQKKDVEAVFVAGGQKCATSWIYRQLKLHPMIAASTPKEPHYFSDLKTIQPDGKGLRLTPAPYRKHALTEFWKLFSITPQTKCVADFSTSYLHSNEARMRIKKHFPQAKIVISVRNPIDRTFSSFIGNSSKNIPRSLAKTLEKFPIILQRSFFSAPIQEYVNTFGSQNVLVILYDDIVANSEAVLKQITDFLGVEPLTQISKEKQRSAETKRLKIIHSRFNQLPGGKQLFWLLKTLPFFSNIKNIVSRLIGRRNMRASEKSFLYPFFSKEISRLETITKRNLSHWRP